MIRFWWQEKEDNAHERLFTYVEQLRKNQAERIRHNLMYLRLYGNRNYYVTGNGNIEVSKAWVDQKVDRSKINVIQSVCDTITSKIAKNKPRPMFLTQGYDQNLAKRAKLLGDFVEGLFLRTDIYTKMADVFLDSTIFDIGALKIFRDGPEIKCEKVFPNELYVDEQEARFGTATHLYQIKEVSRYSMEQEFGDLPLSEDTGSFGPVNEGYDDNMVCVEAWHLPSGRDADDGRHVICVDNKTLVDEEWEFDKFPFIFLRWNKANLSWYGQSLTEQLFGIQYEINTTLKRIEQSIHLLAVPFVMIEAGSNVSPSHIRNVEGTIIQYTGTPPSVYTPNTVPQEVFSHLDRMKRDAYEISGISQLSATSTKPAGVTAGIALRTLQDVETERFMTTAQNYESAFMEAADWIIKLVKRADEEGAPLTVLGMQRKNLRKLKWKEVSLDENEYLMRVFPVSLLPSTPTGRLQTIQELINSGVISSKEQILKLLDVPDLEHFQSLATANEEYVDFAISQILEGRSPVPEPYPQMDFDFAIDRLNRSILDARLNSVSDKKLNEMLTWLNRVQDYKDKSEEQALMKQLEQQQMQQQAQMQMQMQMQQQQAQQPQGPPQEGPPPEGPQQPMQPS